MTKLLDGGNDSGRLNLVLVGDGYTAADGALFLQHAGELVKAIQGEPWYRPGLLNVHSLFVASGESTLDLKPGQGPRDTAFRFRLGGEGKLDRVISGDDEAVRVTVDDWWRGMHAAPLPHIGVLCNALYEGGNGGPKGQMFWVTAGRRGKVLTTGMPSWCDMALHEWGHSLFGLGDEYQGEAGRKTWPSVWPEPQWPNVTKDPTGAKWREIVPHSPFEGAGRYDKGLYRPTATCRMRAPGRWCPVCEDVVRRKLESYLSDRTAEPVAPGQPEPVATTRRWRLESGGEVWEGQMTRVKP